jgi:hypothetical protein
VDRDWFEVQLGKFEDEIVPEISQFKLPVQRLSMTKLYDETHNEIGNVLAIFAKRSEQMLENNETSGRLIHRFSESTFLKTEHRLLPYLKVTGLSTNVTIKKHEPIIRPMRTQGFVHFVLRNLRDGSEQVIRLRLN